MVIRSNMVDFRIRMVRSYDVSGVIFDTVYHNFSVAKRTVNFLARQHHY